MDNLGEYFSRLICRSVGELTEGMKATTDEELEVILAQDNLETLGRERLQQDHGEFPTLEHLENVLKQHGVTMAGFWQALETEVSTQERAARAKIKEQE